MYRNFNFGDYAAATYDWLSDGDTTPRRTAASLSFVLSDATFPLITRDTSLSPLLCGIFLLYVRVRSLECFFRPV